jgi:hypothetical protein
MIFTMRWRDKIISNMRIGMFFELNYLKSMKGEYDLYETYYPNINDAINAEMSQCNEIDNR